MDIPQELRFKTRSGADVVITEIRNSGLLPISGQVYLDGEWKKALWARDGSVADNKESPLDIDFDNTDIVKIQ